MISDKELLEYKKKAEDTVGDLAGLQFNHFGIQAKDRNAYNHYISNAGGAYSEVSFRGRDIATIKSKSGIIEVLEPKPDQIVKETTIDHVAYICSDIDLMTSKYKSQIITKFDIGNTHGFKINPLENIIVEIRNNDILESVKDFSVLG